MKKMKVLFVLMALSISFTSIALASVADDIRISDNSGNVLAVNSDGSLTITVN